METKYHQGREHKKTEVQNMLRLAEDANNNSNYIAMAKIRERETNHYTSCSVKMTKQQIIKKNRIIQLPHFFLSRGYVFPSAMKKSTMKKQIEV